MTYDELGTFAARAHGIVWDSKDSAGGVAMWVAVTQQGPTSFAGWQPRVQGVSQHWHLTTEHTGVLGWWMMGCRKQTAVPEGVPRYQPESPRRCHGVLLPVWWLPGSSCSFPSATWSNSQGPVPPPAQGNAAGCEAGSGMPGAVLSHPNCSLAIAPGFALLLLFGRTRPELAGWGYFGHSCTPFTLVSAAFEPLLPC